MQRTGWITLATSVVVGPLPVLLNVMLGISLAVAAMGALLAADMLLRARRSLRRDGDLLVAIESKRLSAWQPETNAIHADLPVLSAQAFPDHVQIVTGHPPTRLRQVEVPLDGEQRVRLIEWLRSEGFPVGERPAVGTHLLLCLTVVPVVVMVLYLAYRAFMLTLAIGVLDALVTLGGEGALVGLAVLAMAVVVVTFRRNARK